MPSNPYAAYIESSVLTAEPIELVRILYRTALENVRNARTFLAEGDIPARSKAVAKAIDILHELSFSLRHENEPTLARNLVELYDYMQRRLLAANLGQSAEPLAEVETLLATMSEAWDRINPELPREAAPEGELSVPAGRIATEA
jgi:flagellar secretion chaperone FliS